MVRRSKILFVEDRPDLLEELRNAFRSLRQEWALAFAKSGMEAMEILSKVPFDSVVSNLAIPGRDEIPFLKTVMKMYPNIVRVALLVESGGEDSFRSVYPAQHCLFKPYDPEKLKTILKRAQILQSRLADQRLHTVFSKMQTFPGMPAIYPELMRETALKEVTIQRIGKILSRDEGVVSSILKLATSAFSDVVERISSLAQAVSLLGLDTIEGHVLSVEFYSRFGAERIRELTGGGLLDHNMSVAVFAKEIARMEGLSRGGIGKAFAVGMLHDSGKLLMAVNFPSGYRQVVALARERRIGIPEAEKQVFGITHAEVGARLLSLWGLPDFIVEAVAFHHEPGACPSRGFNLVSAVHVANALAGTLEGDSTAGIPGPKIDGAHLKQAGLADRFTAWKDHCLGLVHASAG